MKSEAFTNVLPHVYRKAWVAFKSVVEGVLGKNRVPPDQIKERVTDLLKYYIAIGASMTLKLHFLHYHLDVFLKQLSQESDEQGERFHQTTKTMETRYKGKKLDALLAEVCWWTSKISEYESAHTEETEGMEGIEDTEGHTEIDMPLNSVSDADSDDEYVPPTRRMRISDPQASSSNN